MGADRIDRAASELFGWESVRDGQRRSVEALLEGRDVVAVMPTGAGKSAVYQLAGALRDGLTLVVSPLIALQTDQLEQLSAAPAAPRGAAVNSSLGARAIEDAWAQAESGGIRFLFLAPEQLAKDEALDRLAGLDVGLLVVDEAHCVASWGHDFRPDYLRLGDARERLGGPLTVALTATAAEPVREEIVRRLSLEDPLLVVQGVDRPNIDLEVRRHADESEKRQHLLDLVAELDGCGLVYAATRRDAEEHASALAERGIRSLAYHAGLPAKDRRAVQEAFHVGHVDVVVATSAFGMGIDKPDVRFVVHASVPESLDAYYQEVGRAGRDGEAARAVLFYRSADLGIRKYCHLPQRRPGPPGGRVQGGRGRRCADPRRCAGPGGAGVLPSDHGDREPPRRGGRGARDAGGHRGGRRTHHASGRRALCGGLRSAGAHRGVAARGHAPLRRDAGLPAPRAAVVFR